MNLAAQAGVRYSIENPHSYVESNIVGFMNILECCRHFNTNGLVYALVLLFMEAIKKFHFLSMIIPIIQYQSMQFLKDQMN